MPARACASTQGVFHRPISNKAAAAEVIRYQTRIMRKGYLAFSATKKKKRAKWAITLQNIF